MPNVRSRGWCFTINNPTGWDTADIERLSAACQYLIKGNEVGEEGTPHWQGFVYFQNKKSFSQVREALPRAHIEKQRGTFEQAIDYCKKEGDFREWGTAPSGPTGQKNKWKDVMQLARQGKLEEIEDKYPAIFFRY